MLMHMYVNNFFCILSITDKNFQGFSVNSGLNFMETLYICDTLTLI